MVQGNPPSSPPSPRLTWPGPSSFCWCISRHSPSPYPNHTGVLPVPLKYTHKTSCHLRVRAFAFVYGSIIPKMMKMRARMYLVHVDPIEKKKIMAKFLEVSYSLRHFLMLSEPCETRCSVFGGICWFGGMGWGVAVVLEISHFHCFGAAFRVSIVLLSFFSRKTKVVLLW